jgi:hypothetical protein
VIGTAGGHSTDALTTAQEAVDRYRQLAALNRDAHLPNLAAAVNNLANRLAETGRRTPGRPGAAQEAVWLFRQARQIHGPVYDDDVARTERLVARLTDAVGETDNAELPSTS